jgi:hypothetical protein
MLVPKDATQGARAEVVQRLFSGQCLHCGGPAEVAIVSRAPAACHHPAGEQAPCPSCFEEQAAMRLCMADFQRLTSGWPLTQTIIREMPSGLQGMRNAPN